MLKSDYQIKPNEEGYVHVRFTRIVKGKGKRTSDVHTFQKFTVKDFDNLKTFVEKHGLAGVTQQDEMEVVHDPRLHRSVSNSVEDTKSEADEIRAYLTEKGIKFDSRLGLKKLKELKLKTE